MHSKWCPELGLNGPSAVDPREVTGCGGMVFNHEDPLSCFRCYYDWIWEDHRLEQLRASDYMEQVDIKLGKLQHASGLTDDQIILLPDTVYGFVLRNRKWGRSYFLCIPNFHTLANAVMQLPSLSTILVTLFRPKKTSRTWSFHQDTSELLRRL